MPIYYISTITNIIIIKINPLIKSSRKPSLLSIMFCDFNNFAIIVC